MQLSSFLPKPLKKLDQYLLENHPVVWSSRIHWVLFFGLIFNALCFGVSYIYTLDPREEQSSMPILLIAIFLMSFIFILTFLFYHLRFNVLKKFGNISQLGLMLHFIYYIFFFILAITPLIYPTFTQYLNTINKYSKDELFKDIFNYNKAVAVSEYESPLLFRNTQKGQKYILLTDPKFYSDSINTYGYKTCNFFIDNEELTASINDANGRREYNLENVPNFEYLDSTDYYQSIANSDSIHLLSDKTFEEIEFPDYNFVKMDFGNSEYHDDYPVKKLYEAVLLSKNTDKQKSLTQVNFIKNKYTLKNNTYDDYRNYTEVRDYEKVDSIYHYDFTYTFEQKYGFDNIEKQLNRIYERLHQFKDDFFNYIIYLILYFALGAAALLWLFRVNSKKTFFFTFIYGGIIAIIIILLSAIYFIFIGHFDEYEINFFLNYGIIPLVFGILSLKIFKDNRQLNISIFNANIFFLMVYFIPLYILGIWINSQYILIDKISNIDMRFHLRYQLKETISNMLIPCQIMGFILLCLMILLYFSKLYKRWIALPEE